MGEGAIHVRGDAAGRLATARGVLRRLEDRAVGPHPAVEPGADGRLLPVVAALADVLPSGGLRRGSTVAVAAGTGSTSLLTALLARASATGLWAGVVGRPDLGYGHVDQLQTRPGGSLHQRPHSTHSIELTAGGYLARDGQCVRSVQHRDRAVEFAHGRADARGEAVRRGGHHGIPEVRGG